ncbi:MAG TPA: CBS domain-containing protein [Planctomycetota bacterium]
MKRATDTVTRPWHEMKALEVMTAPVVTLNEDILLREAARILSDEHIGGAPVVDHRGEPLGVVSLFDIVSDLAGLERSEGELGGFYRQGKVRFSEPEEVEEDSAEETPDGETTVAEIMAPGIIGVSAEASLDEVVRLLRDKQIHRVFVLDVAGRLLGVISTMDILRVLGKEA